MSALTCHEAKALILSPLQEKPQADRTRVGAETNDLLTEGGIGSTVITFSNKEGGKALAQKLSKL